MTQMQRTFKRKTVDLDLDISMRELGQPQVVPIKKILDLSYGGIKILSNHKIDINADIAITIKLDDYKLKFIGEVKRCETNDNQNYEIGIQYITISRKNLNKLYQLLK